MLVELYVIPLWHYYFEDSLSLLWKNATVEMLAIDLVPRRKTNLRSRRRHVTFIRHNSFKTFDKWNIQGYPIKYSRYFVIFAISTPCISLK